MHRDGRFFFRAVYLQNKPHQKGIDHQNKLIQDLLSRIGGNTFKQSLAEQVYSLSYPVFWAATQLKVEVLRRLEKHWLKIVSTFFYYNMLLTTLIFLANETVLMWVTFCKKDCTAPEWRECRDSKIQKRHFARPPVWHPTSYASVRRLQVWNQVSNGSVILT